jgi:molecular chaperone DnaK
MSKVVGIDLGTTNSAIAHVEDGEAEIIRNEQGNYTMPSVVQFGEDETVVGKMAYSRRVTKSDEIVEHIKRHMGEDYETDEIHGNTYRPEQVSGFILEKLRKDAEEKFGNEDVSSAVITVPAYFGVAQREATKTAAELVDLEVERVINEPTAACLRYAKEVEGELLEGEKETVFIYDLGGGTFDATLVEVGNGTVRAMGTDGNKQLGGEDLTNELYEHIKQAFLDAGNQVDDPSIESTLRQEAKEAKEDLSQVESRMVSVHIGGGFEFEVTRDEFEDQVEHLVEDTLHTVDELFADENVDCTKDDVDRVLLVGGSTRTPIVQERVEDYFGIEPSKELDPDYVVAQGAAIQADNLDVDYEVDDTSGPTNNGGDDESTKLVDVISHTVGVEVYEEDGPNSLEPILEANEEVPAENDDVFTTTEDNQTIIEVRIFEGEDPIAEENNHLGSFELSDLDPRPAGEPTIDVTFKVTEEGVIKASANDKGTDKKATATVDVGLTEKEKQDLMQEIANVPAVK